MDEGAPTNWEGTGVERAETPPPNPLPENRYELLDQVAHATVARFTGGVSPYAAAEAWFDWLLHLSRAPGRQLELVERAQVNSLALGACMAGWLLRRSVTPPFTAGAKDPRFRHSGWAEPPFLFWQQGFLAMQDWWDHAAGDLRGLRPQNSDRVRFMLRQWLDMLAPSNFPGLNPEIIEETVKQDGRNLWDGAEHFADDLLHVLTQEQRPAPEGFKLGTDLAATPGEVVFRNRLFELIQYTPQTENVHSEPILFVPAWIMKYYVLDLSPHNSLIGYLVRNGFTVFVMSWCNPTRAEADLSLEDYRTKGVMAALDAIGAICPGQRIHANGYCLGGTMLSIAAAKMARDGDDRLASITLMAAQVDFSEAGELLLFLGDSQVAFLEDMMRDQGYLSRPQMSGAFAAIRAEDLIYTRAVQRYFLGKPDLPSDLGVWTADTTRMPARMHSEYLRGLFLENRLTAGRFAVEGRVIALKDLTVPMFVVGTETDHIAPWRSVYKTSLFTDNDMVFVLTKGGHNGGILSEPGHAGRHYRIGTRKAGFKYIAPDQWRERHEPIPGSWWPELLDWLKRQNPKTGAPPPMGNAAAGLPVLCPAPGTYVHQS